MIFKAKRLVFSLISASRNRTVSAGDIVAASALFDVSESNVRVILLRLLAETLLEQPSRGVYQLSPKARLLANEVRLWRTRESRVRQWTGRYVVIHSERGFRPDAASLRRRNQALGLLGFRDFESRFWIRPNNLEANITALRQRICELGLEREALLHTAGDFDGKVEEKILNLWDTQLLNERYVNETAQLRKWLDAADRMDLHAALRESYLWGAEAIKGIAFDPMLPEPMVDTKARKQFIDAACQLDDVGHSLWERFLEQRSVTAKVAVAA